MSKIKILVVEDDIPILMGLVDLLTSEGYEVFQARDGISALKIYKQESPNLVLLDIMIPEKSGYDVCREIRKEDSIMPIIMLTAKGQEVDKVVGLEIGADDYIVKPFGINELLARVRAVLRRKQPQPKKDKQDAPISFGNIYIDPKTFKGRKGRKLFDVTLREIQLLQMFIHSDGEVLDRVNILDEIWGIKYEGTTRTLDQHIAKLRQKIEDNPVEPKHILTVHGVGYRFISKTEK